MNSNIGMNKTARKIPAHRLIPRLLKDPIPALEKIGEETAGEIVRLDLGLFRPYLVTRPEHVQHVLKDNASNYLRDGMMWKPLRRLTGDGLAGVGKIWEAQRKLFNLQFSAKHVTSLIDQMVEAITEVVDGLEPYARTRTPIDSCTEMTRIAYRVIGRVFFGDRITADDAYKLGRAIEAAMTSMAARMLLPIVPEAFPLPGDRAFRRAIRTVHEIMDPLIHDSRRQATSKEDIVSLMCQARDPNGKELDDQAIRDDVVAVFAAGTESTGVAMTWLWMILDSHPAVADQLYGEIGSVVGTDTPTRSHLEELRYTKMVFQELLRLYPVGWVIPRTAAAEDTIDGVQVRRGDTVVISPYLTHRMDALWDRPLAFDPERFSSERKEHRHRFSYFPFSYGPHMCLGTHFFNIEGLLILAILLAKYRPKLCQSVPVSPQASVSLRPRTRVNIVLQPIDQARPV